MHVIEQRDRINGTSERAAVILVARQLDNTTMSNEENDHTNKSKRPAIHHAVIINLIIVPKLLTGLTGY